MTEIYLHVGLPKTGTTFLQEQCFPHLNGVHYLYKGFKRLPTGIMEEMLYVVDGHPLFAEVERHRAEVERLLGDVAEEKVLISWERLFGDVLSGFRDNPQVTDGLRRLFPSAKIIITIRRQDDFLESLYRNHLRNYHYPKIDAFLGYTGERFERWIWQPATYPHINVWRLDYRAYVRNYAEAFGRRNVLVLPYELLRADPPRYLKETADFIGVEPYHPAPGSTGLNRSYSLPSCRIALALNRFVRAPRRERRPWQVIPHEPLTPHLRRRREGGLAYRALDALNRRLSLRYVLENVVDRVSSQRGGIISAEKRRQIMEIHRASNRDLDEEFDLGLRDHGYY